MAQAQLNQAQAETGTATSRMQPLWWLREDPHEVEHLLKAISVDMSNRIVNSKVFDHALFELYHTQSIAMAGDRKLPPGFVIPVLSLPPLDFEPDLFSMRGNYFASRRFRDALAQPSDVVQYWPVEIERASDEAREQDYMLFRVLAAQPSMDWERSRYHKDKGRNRRTGETFTTVSMLTCFVPLAGLVPQTEVFRSAEVPLTVLVVDSVAERIMRAGCTGIRFRDPETCWLDGMAERHRTADGVLVIEP